MRSSSYRPLSFVALLPLLLIFFSLNDTNCAGISSSGKVEGISRIEKVRSVKNFLPCVPDEAYAKYTCRIKLFFVYLSEVEKGNLLNQLL